MVAPIPGLIDSASVWAELAKLLEPPSFVHPIRWADENARLSQLDSAISGPWRTLPYQRAVMDAWVDPTVEEIDLVWGTQTGKSKLWQVLLDYCAARAPGPAMVIAADEQAALKLSKVRIYPMLEACPEVERLLPPKRERVDLLINLTRMLVFFAWSGSPSTMGGESVRYVFMTELDKYSAQATIQGDPEALGSERVKGFPGGKIFKECSPTTEGASRSWRNWLASDQREYHVPCPHCGTYQVFGLGTSEPGKSGLKWDKLPTGKSDPDLARKTAWYECGQCHGRITDQQKPWMIFRGFWCRKGERIVKTGEVAWDALEAFHNLLAARGLPAGLQLEGLPERSGARAGFRLSSFYSPFITFGQIAEKFLEAQKKGVRFLQAFVNGWLAEVWKEGGEAPDWEQVGARLILKGLSRQVPAEAAFLTAGVDVQEYRVYYVVRAWGRLGTSWLIDFGETEDLEEIDVLLLKAEYPRVDSDEPVTILRCAVDSGYRPDHTYDFCRAAGPRAVAVKGQARWRAPFTIANIEINPRTKRPYPGGQRLYHVGVNHYKPEIHHRLKNGPGAGEPGAFNLCEHVTEDYLRQLCGEALTKGFDKRGYAVEEWTVVDTAVGNHYFDCEVYAWAAAEIAGLRKLKTTSAPVITPKSTSTHPRTVNPTRTDTWAMKRFRL